MDFVSLRTFCRAIEEGNLTAAAKAVHVTKSVASRRIHMLEDELNTKLLIRTTKGVSATDAGALFYERAINLLADAEDAKQSVACVGSSIVGTLRITAPRGFTDTYLAKVFSAFMKEYPDLILELNLTDERVDIIGGGYDLGLRATHRLDDNSLIAKKITPLKGHVVASPAYLEKHGTPTKPEDLKNHHCSLYSNIPAARTWKFYKNGKEESVRVNGSIISNSGIMQLESAKAGIAITLLPKFFIQDTIETGELVEVLPDWDIPQTYLYALYPDRRLLPIKVRVFIDYIHNWFTEQKNNPDL